TPRPGRLGGSTLNGLAGMMLIGAGSAFGRDPRRGCGTGSWDVDWIGERMAYGYQYGLNQTAQKKSGFSFAGFGKEVLAGAITGGLASAAFYGAGKAVEALAGSIRSNKGGSATLKPDELVVRDSKFLDADGNIDWNTWAPNGGRVPGTIQGGQTLDVGTIIDRYGNPYGKYTSPVGIPYEQRALPYVENPSAYHKYEVLKPIDNVTISRIAEAFEQPGGGMQYELPSIVNKLISDNFLREIR
ncbi:TNT domain-containing protein, partial [Lachnospiraceae bacterium 64-25]